MLPRLRNKMCQNFYVHTVEQLPTVWSFEQIYIYFKVLPQETFEFSCSIFAYMKKISASHFFVFGFQLIYFPSLAICCDDSCG